MTIEQQYLEAERACELCRGRGFIVPSRHVLRDLQGGMVAICHSCWEDNKSSLLYRQLNGEVR